MNENAFNTRQHGDVIDRWHMQDATIGGVNNERNKGFRGDEIADVINHGVNGIVPLQYHPGKAGVLMFILFY